MEPKYQPLFTPWKIGNVEIKNRIVMCSMGGTCLFGFAEPNHWDEEAAKLILNVAKNNCGLILPGIAPLQDLVGNRWLYQGEGKFKKLKSFMDEVHKTGAKLFVQLTAGFGRSFAVSTLMENLYTNKLLRALSKPAINIDRLTMSASENPNRWSDKVPSRAMTQKEIADIIDAFARVAKKCMDAGVDGVEVHAVHEGYLLDQFTLPYVNRRQDEYGGSFENRYRFAVEVVQAIKKACGKDYPVSLRYSVVSKTKDFRVGALPCEGDEYKEVGRDLEEGIKAAKYLQDAGYDMLNCDNGTYDAWYWSHPPMYMPQNCNYREAELVKEAVSIPVVVAGRNEPDYAAEKIAFGKVDAMGVARQFLADPEWITKLMAGKPEEIRPCICCHNGCFALSKYKGTGNLQSVSETQGMCQCAVNPESMNSKKFYIRQTANPKHIAVIGGGIGGMETARVLALRGHRVTLYEKSGDLGGVFIPAASFEFKEKDRSLIEWYKKQIAELGVEVKLNTEIKDISSIDADDVIVATGATARKLPVPGAEKAIDAVSYLKDRSQVGKKVVVIGGSLTGCEIAYELYNQGKEPVIIEMKEDLMAVKGICLANASYLRDFFQLKKVPVYLNTTVKEIRDDSVVALDKDGKEIPVSCDSVILCVGYIPQPLSCKNKNLVGDCYRVGNIMTAVWRAWEVAMKK